MKLIDKLLGRQTKMDVIHVASGRLLPVPGSQRTQEAYDEFTAAMQAHRASQEKTLAILRRWNDK
jgi:hypothetical protein